MIHTKIICTMGPACSGEATLRAMLLAGMNVARLNFSHGSYEQHAATIALLRGIADDLSLPLAILQDLCGPKIRIGDVPGGTLQLSPGDSVVLSDTPSPEEVSLPYPGIVDAARPQNRILIADGAIQLEVTEKTDRKLHCRTLVGGLLIPHKGVNIPGVALPVEPLTEKDREDLAFGIAHDVDWIAQSFVRRAEDVRKLRRLVAAAGSDAPIIAKIEQAQAVENLPGIIAAADGVMVARGDLGVELPLEQVPVVQKQVIHACNAAGKPVITATQMLESMIQNPRPTRAEVTDVCNAILDGTDAIMLSAETSVGSYPAESVQMMNRIASRTEASLEHHAIWQARSQETGTGVGDAIGEATVELAERLKVKAIVCATSSGAMARLISRFRPSAAILAATTSTRTWNRLSLSWGVRPLLVPLGRNFDATLDNAIQGALNAGLLHPEDQVIFTAGSAVGSPGTTNVIKVHVVGRRDHFA